MKMFQSASALKKAIEHHDMAKVRSYLKDENAVTSWTQKMMSKYGVTPLSVAARANDLDILDHLLSLKADIHAQNDTGATALYGACAAGAHDAVIFLLDHGARVDQDRIRYLEEYEIYEGTSKVHYQDEDEAYPLLQQAVENIELDVFSRLLDTTKNDTDLHLVFNYICNNDIDISHLDVMLKKGFDPAARDLHSVLEAALVSNKNPQALIRLADYMPEYISPQALVSIASNANLVRIYDIYAEENLIPPAHPMWEFDVVYSAISRENWSFIKRVKSKEYNVDAKNIDGETCLHIAIKKSNHYLVARLIEAGAKIKTKSRMGWNGYDYAQKAMPSRTASTDMCELLLSYGPTKAETVQQNNAWEKTDDAEVTHISTVEGSRKRITDSFNFKNKERLTIIDDLEMKTQSPIRENFDRVAPHILKSAFDEYKRLGGNDIDEDVALSILPPKSSPTNNLFDKGNPR